MTLYFLVKDQPALQIIQEICTNFPKKWINQVGENAYRKARNDARMRRFHLAWDLRKKGLSARAIGRIFDVGDQRARELWLRGRRIEEMRKPDMFAIR